MIDPDQYKRLQDAILNGPAYRLDDRRIQERPYRHSRKCRGTGRPGQEWGRTVASPYTRSCASVRTGPNPHITPELAYLVDEGFFDERDSELFSVVDAAKEIVSVQPNSVAAAALSGGAACSVLKAQLRVASRGSRACRFGRNKPWTVIVDFKRYIIGVTAHAYARRRCGHIAISLDIELHLGAAETAALIGDEQ